MFKKKLEKYYANFPAVLFLIFGAACIAMPAKASDGFLKGLQSAFFKVVPSVFPLITVTVMLFNSRLCGFLGCLFTPVLRLYKIKSRSAASAVFLGVIGGFAPFCKAVSLCLKKGYIKPFEAEILLCAGIGTGPAFIICGVGMLMFNSAMLGIKIFLSLIISGFVSAYFVFLFKKPQKSGADSSLIECADNSSANTQCSDISFSEGFIAAVSDACRTCLIMCGFVAFFNTVCSVLSGSNIYMKYIFAFIMEVTCACVNFSGLDSGIRIYLCVAALSFCGLSIIFQSKAILPPQISFKPFFISRLIHIPLSIFIFRVFNLLGSDRAVNVYIAKVNPARFEPDNGIIVIIMVIVFLCEITPTRLFTKGR